VFGLIHGRVFISPDVSDRDLRSVFARSSLGLRPASRLLFRNALRRKIRPCNGPRFLCPGRTVLPRSAEGATAPFFNQSPEGATCSNVPTVTTHPVCELERSESKPNPPVRAAAPDEADRRETVPSKRTSPQRRRQTPQE